LNLTKHYFHLNNLIMEVQYIKTGEQFDLQTVSSHHLLKPIFAHWAVINPSKILTFMQNSPKNFLF